MDEPGTARTTTPGSYPEDGAVRQHADGARPARAGLGRYARPALIAGTALAAVCVALLVIVFALDSFNATVYSVGGKDVRDATDEAKAIRDSYAAARAGGIIFLVLGLVLAVTGGLALYRRRGEAGPDDGDTAEDVDFRDLGGR